MACPDQIKIVILGEGRVGKTSLILKYVKNRFNQSEEKTKEADCLEKYVEIGFGQTVKIDTVGQEKYRALTPIYFRDVAGALLVYDFSINTCNEVIPMMIVGNKTDLPSFKKQVSKSEGEQIAKQFGAKHLITSAKTGEGVVTAFETLTRDIMNFKKKSDYSNYNGIICRPSITLDYSGHQGRITKQGKVQNDCC